MAHIKQVGWGLPDRWFPGFKRREAEAEAESQKLVDALNAITVVTQTAQLVMFSAEILLRHKPNVDSVCAECAQPYPCATAQIAYRYAEEADT